MHMGVRATHPLYLDTDQLISIQTEGERARERYNCMYRQMKTCQPLTYR